MRILVVNLHSSHNAGDHALTLESVRQLRHFFDEPEIVLSLNDPDSSHADGTSLGAFSTWLRRTTSSGEPGWRLLAGPWLLLAALLAGLIWRLTGHLPSLGLDADKQRLLRAYTEADAIMSCAGNVFYTSGRVGFPFILSIFTIGYGWLLGKPTYTLPQSMGPIRHRWEGWGLRLLASRLRLMLVREPRSVALLESLGISASKYRLVPDIAFAYPERDQSSADALLRDHLGEAFGRVPLLGITAMNWGAQNRRFGGQEAFEEAIRATIRRLLDESDGHVLLFSQVWGPTESEDDRVPARRIAAPFAGSARVHLVDRPLNPAILKGCYARLALLLGTRMHSNIFALSEGTPVLAIGYRSKSWGIMEMLGLQKWLIGIEEASAERLPPLVMEAWARRDALRTEVERLMPGVRQRAGEAVRWLAEDVRAVTRRQERLAHE